MAGSRSTGSTRGAKPSVGRRLLYAGCAVIVSLSLAEAVCRVFGLGGRPDHSQIHWVFTDDPRLFHPVSESGDATVFGRNKKLAYPGLFRHPTFVMPKPRGTFRAFCVGGSAAFGTPHKPRLSFPARLEDLLSRTGSFAKPEIINAAVPGLGCRGVRVAVSELLSYDPDLLIVYSGNNEFLSYNLRYIRRRHAHPYVFRLRRALAKTGLYALLKIPAQRIHGTLEEDMGIPPTRPTSPISMPIYRHDEYEVVAEAYAENVRDIARLCRDRGVRLILCTVAANLRDHEPQASVHGPSVSPEARRRWLVLFLRGHEEWRHGRPRSAIVHLRAAVEADSYPAEAHFLLGRAYEQCGETVNARRHYALACDQDGAPRRVVSRLNAAVRWVAQAEGALLCDVAREFCALATGAASGDDLFYDHCHLRPRAQMAVALLLCRTLQQGGLVSADVADFARAAGEVESSGVFVHTPEEEAAALEHSAKEILRNTPFRFDDFQCSKRAAERLARAIELDPHRASAVVQLVEIIDRLSGSDAAADVLEKALERCPRLTDFDPEIRRLAERLQRDGVPDR